MIIKLLIGTTDRDYSEYLSNVLSERYSETFEVSVTSSTERLTDMLTGSRYDVALLEPEFTADVSLSPVNMPLLLVEKPEIDDGSYNKVRKYQRISLIVGDILENYAQVSKVSSSFGAGKARITAVWSPAGGAGKTTVALAYAAKKVLEGKQVSYLCLENFASTSVYFQEGGKSISKVFEKLDSNVQMFLMGIRQQDSATGISYFCGPENYEDINILTVDDIQILLDACATGIDELVIDLSSQCDERIQKILDIVDKILLVCDSSSTSQVKIKQFINQHNLFEKIEYKTLLVNNKGSKFSDEKINKSVQLQYASIADPISVFKSLSSANFE